MSDLFDIPETLSPRLAWMKEHGIQSIQNPEYGNWIAWFGDAFTYRATSADTQDEALDALAARLNIKPWRS